MILAQEPTRIEAVPIRPTVIKHKKGRDPRWEARMMARYFYEKAEAGKIGYRRFDEIEV